MGCTQTKALGNIEETDLKPAFDKLKKTTDSLTEHTIVLKKDEACVVYPDDLVDVLCTMECIPGQHNRCECFKTPTCPSIWVGNDDDNDIEEFNGMKSNYVEASGSLRIMEQ